MVHKPLCDNLSHDLVGVVDALAAMEDRGQLSFGTDLGG